MKRLIEITQKHIDEGVRGSAMNCAIAHAIRDAIGGDVSVGIWEGHVNGIEFEIPHAIRRFTGDFDLGLTVHPTDFEIELPDQEVSS